MVIAVYPGTFDPLTRGHEDLVRRASGLFDELIVGVADSRVKKPFFSMEERMQIAKEVLGHYPERPCRKFYRAVEGLRPSPQCKRDYPRLACRIRF